MLDFYMIADKACCDSQSGDVDCWNINIYSNDSFYSTHGQTCMDFTRSLHFAFQVSPHVINGVANLIN